MTGMTSKDRSLVRGLTLILLFSFIGSIATGTTINSHFHGENTASDGETTFYSYLKQSDLKESEYKRGLETGTLNYFKGKVKLDDEQKYYDGKIDAAHPGNLTNTSRDYLHNSTVDHTLKIDYNGKKGLSLFYAKGFYTTNRAIAASKKLWFLNESYYPTKSIDLVGIARMDMGGKYLMDYNIKEAKQAYLVIDDTAGFSNKTGSRRIDFQQQGLMKGDISNVKNYLYVEDEFIARSGIYEDWLPCFCVFSLEPPIEGLDSPWPTKEIEYALSHPEEQKAQTKVECANCGSGYCGETTKGGPIIEFPDVWVDAFYEMEEADEDGYSIYEFTIEVKNTGTSRLEDVKLVAQVNLAKDKTEYIPDSGTIDGRISSPGPLTTSNSIMLLLGNLEPVLPEPEAKKTVVMQLNSSEDLEDSIKFYAIYRVGSKVSSTAPLSPIGEVSNEAW